MPASNLKQASFQLTFLVIGGGLAGLACGYTLSTAGHKVTIIEQNEPATKTEGSIRCPPNMTTILSCWPGMEAFLHNNATKITGLSFRDGETCEEVGFMKFYRQIMRDLGAEFLVMQYDDLRQEMKALCLAAAVQFKHGRAVDITEMGDFLVRVTLEDGTTHRGNIAIGADGHNSFVRSCVMPSEVQPKAIVSGVNISISTQDMLEKEEFRSICEENQFTLWMGSGSCITGVLDRDSETFNLAVCAPARLDFPGDDDDDWYKNWNVSQVKTRFNVSGYDPRLQKLIELGNSCRPTTQLLFEQEEAVGLNGTVILVGDAAHSATIHGSHNTSLAVRMINERIDGSKLTVHQFEDAATLGALFSHLTNRKQIPAFLETYEEFRQYRAQATQESEYQGLLQISLPRGVLQEARDATLELTIDREFEDFENFSSAQLESDVLVKVWEGYLVVFNYDAGEVVEDWWSKWGFNFEN